MVDPDPDKPLYIDPELYIDRVSDPGSVTDSDLNLIDIRIRQYTLKGFRIRNRHYESSGSDL